MNKYLDGSSETLRKVTFNFKKFNKFYLPEHKKKIDQSFLEWFVGFTEGDGSFIITVPKKGNKRLMFILVQKDEQALNKLRSTIGFGNIQKHRHAHRYCVSKKKDIDRLIVLFNGNLLLNKTNEKFRLWVNTRNELNQKQPRIEVQSQLRNFDYLGNGWLSGFIAAEGCFNVRHPFSDYHSKFFVDHHIPLRFRFILDQKNEGKLLESIRISIGSGNVSRRKEDFSQFRYTIGHRNYIILIIDYIKKFPLRVKKNVDVVRMQKLINYSKSRKTRPWSGRVFKRVKALIFRLDE